MNKLAAGFFENEESSNQCINLEELEFKSRLVIIEKLLKRGNAALKDFEIKSHLVTFALKIFNLRDC